MVTPADTQDASGSSEKQSVSEKEDSEAEFANPISIPSVDGLSEEFLFVCDVSTLIAQEKSGVVYYNEKGEEQGQAEAVRDCVNVLASFGENAVGVCYWEPAWIPVPEDGEMSRSEIWEKYGSGWASSFAAEYDPNDAGQYYGGSAWDNQALFDAEGHPLASIQMFEMMRE